MSDFIPTPERQKQILTLLTRQGRLSVTEIVEQFSISEATVRRDLESLASQGKAQRVHGGVIAIEQAPPELPILERENEQPDEKTRIGRAVASLITDKETVFLGSGTTVLEVARNLRDRRNLTVITNSLPVLNTLAGIKEITVITLGGMLRDSELSFIGHITEQALPEVRADIPSSALPESSTLEPRIRPVPGDFHPAASRRDSCLSGHAESLRDHRDDQTGKSLGARRRPAAARIAQG